MPISIVINRNRTPSMYIGYGLYFYFSGLSLGRTSQTLSSHFIKRNHFLYKSGTGYKSTSPKGYRQRKISLRSLSLLTRHCLKSVQNWCGSGLQLSLQIRKFFQSAYPRKETCLWPNVFYPAFWKNMGNILFRLMVEHGTHKHADSWVWSTISIPLVRKASLNVQCNTSRTGPNALMTIFLAKRRNAN